MMQLSFPILQVAGESVTGFVDEDAFRRAVSLTTDKALGDGFFDAARLFGSDLVVQRIAKVRLGRAPVFGWLKKQREIQELELVPIGNFKLGELKSELRKVISESEFWKQNESTSEVLAEVSAAKTLRALIEIFS